MYDDSTGLYAAGQKWLKQQDVHGKVKGYLPYIGYITIILTEYRPVIVSNEELLVEVKKLGNRNKI